MDVHKDPTEVPTGFTKEATTTSTFGNQSTGFSTGSGFGRQTNTVFGTFPNQNNQQTQTNNLAAFGSQNSSFGNNIFNNQEFCQPHYFGFGSMMSQQTTNICFTGFGEPKTNYLFNSPLSGTTMKRVKLIFESPDMVFGSSIYKKPNVIVEIEVHPTSNRIWQSNCSDFSFSVIHVEKYNSMFTMKSAGPLKFLVRVKHSTTLFGDNSISPSMNNGNQKITFTFQSNQRQFGSNTREKETIVEVPLPVNNLMSKFSNEYFMVAVGPDFSTNSFEVQTSTNSVFKITFAEKGKYNHFFGNNRQTRSGSVFFDQGRQINAFPSTSSSLFGNRAAFGTNQTFGSSTNGNNCIPSNQAQPMTFNQTVNGGSLFGKLSTTTQTFGAPAGFGVATGPTGICTEKQDKSSSTTGISSFGETNECFESPKAFGTVGGSAFGQVKSIPRPQSGSLFSGFNCSQPFCNNQSSKNNSEEFEFGASSQPATGIDNELSAENLKSAKYNPTFGTEVLANSSLPVETKPNCITAMDEYANKSFEEIRLNDYLRTFPETSPKQNNLTTEIARREEATASNSNTNTITAFSPSNMVGNTNQAFFDQLHQLIPYLNAGSFCKCSRSCNSNKTQSNSQTLANNQPRSNSDSLDNLYVNTQISRLNDNISINEFYNDVFKYLEHIQKQYRHLESTLNNKNATHTSEENSNKSEGTDKTEETPNKNKQKSPMTVFGSSTYSAVKIGLNENSSALNPDSEDTDKVTVQETSEANNSLLFGIKNKPLETDTAGNSAKLSVEEKASETKEDLSKKTDILNEDGINKTPTTLTQTIPVSLFGSSNYSTTNIGFDLFKQTKPVNVANESSVFSSSAFSAAGPTVATSSNITENTKNNEDEPAAKCLSFFTGFNDNIGFGTTSKPVDFSFGVSPSKSSDDVAQTKDTSKTLDDQSNGVKTSTTGIFSSTGSIFETQNTSSSNRVKANQKISFSFGSPCSGERHTRTAVPRKSPDNSSSNSSFSPIKSSKPENIPTGFIFSYESSNTEGKKPSTYAPLFPFNIVSSESANIFASTDSAIGLGSDKLPGLFSMKASTTKADNLREKRESDGNTANISDSKFTDSNNAGGSPGGINIVKAVNSLKSIISNDNKTQEEESTKEKSGSLRRQINEPMDEKDGFVSSPVFKMKKISDILADINDKEENLKESSNKSDSESDISNYSLISNRSLNESSCIQNEQHPTGIVMKRYGYYIQPSKEHLKSKITEDGACLVSNFTIGRKGYGSICFNKEINVAGLNIDNIVNFRNKELITYPNEHNNPQVIADLKKCDVLVTLEQVWPHDDVKHEPIKDPQQLDKLKYEDKLRSVCYKNDVHFVEYRPETGSWLFKMKKFDKVNINCWDVEDEDISLEQKNSTGISKIIKLKQQNRSRARIASRIIFIAKRKPMSKNFI
ncbi:nuclear pore complex protein Nup98-Nup96-like isoform X2 [Eupeodes corollae]|uniref:nuclear pore complex protein Nup98-Nup96-like isoform X2 n=1 Tax=Eupeodes corollae TaxID=290404 RepID=UPI0024918824|nr:nuclear pore complex protein Nup98-Nup96-like isoform X2 [Eupeodes corollae]